MHAHTNTDVQQLPPIRSVPPDPSPCQPHRPTTRPTARYLLSVLTIVVLATLVIIPRLMLLLPVYHDDAQVFGDEGVYMDRTSALRLWPYYASASGGEVYNALKSRIYAGGVWPPFYPVAAAHTGLPAPEANRFATFAFSVITAIPVYFIGCKLRSRVTGLIAAGIYAVHPVFVGYSNMMLSEPTAAFFGLTAIWLVFVFIDRRLWMLAPLIGLAIGCSMLTRGANLALLGAAVIGIAIYSRGWTRWASLAGLLIAAGLVCLPWLWMVYQSEHRIVPICTGGGFNLYGGNSPYSENYTGHVWNAAMFTNEWKALPGSMTWTEKVAAVDATAKEKAIQYVKAHPKRALVRFGKHLRYSLSPDWYPRYYSEHHTGKWWYNWKWAVIAHWTLITLVLLSLLNRSLHRKALCLWLCAIFLLIPAAAIFGSPRFAYLPMLALLPLAASFSPREVYSGVYRLLGMIKRSEA